MAKVKLIKSIENQESIFLKKLLMIMIMNLELDGNVVKNFRDMSISKEQKISGKDFKNLLLAEKLSSKKDFFNSISILFIDTSFIWKKLGKNMNFKFQNIK